MTSPAKCPRCGAEHDIWSCPIVKAIDVDADGKIMRVEFLTPRDCAPPQKVEEPQPDDYPKLGQR
jgi:hypothetical protein